MKLILFWTDYKKDGNEKKSIKNPKTSINFEKTLILSIICNKCYSNDQKVFKEEESIVILESIGISFVTNMNEEYILHQINV